MVNLVSRGILPLVNVVAPCSFWLRAAGVAPAIAYYHLVSDSHVAHVSHLYRFRSVRQFREDLDTFSRQFKPIHLKDLIQMVGARQSASAKEFLLTFDDGFREIYDIVAPILLEKGVPATFFLTTAFLDNRDMAHHNKLSLLIEKINLGLTKAVEEELRRALSEAGIKAADLKSALLAIDYRQPTLVQRLARILDVDCTEYLLKEKPYLTSEQVSALLKMGFTIGGHSVDHPTYATLPLQEQTRQTVESVTSLQKRFSLDYGAFAFPHGHNSASAEFFEQMRQHKAVSLVFSTGGIRKSPRPGHFHRFSMENTSARAEEVIAEEYARGVYRRLKRQANSRFITRH